MIVRTMALMLLFGMFIFPFSARAQELVVDEFVATESGEVELATESAQPATESGLIASPSADEIRQLESIRKEDVTRPEDPGERGEVFVLFDQRPLTQVLPWNFLAWGVQFAVSVGVPANTVILILLLPALATIAAFLRHIIGLPTMGIIVPVALSITLLATGITAGLLLLVTIIVGTMIARVILKRIRIMHMPKMALSVLLVAMMVFGTLVLGATNGVLAVKQLSIFPVLMLILLGERFIALQLDRNLFETVLITTTNLGLGGIGYVVLASATIRNTVLLYPELILFLIPINIAIGRYFGLRLMEYFRFKKLLQYGR